MRSADGFAGPYRYGAYLIMHFEQQIETKKREYTDKYVMVDGSRPELARFKDIVGQVKTVNMSGRALVEFMDYHLNVGWYDIDPEFLRVVEKPPPKVEKPAAKKPAAAAKSPAKEKPQAPASAAGKPSVADILAAARAGKAGGAPPRTTVEAASAAGTAKPAVASPQTEPQAALKVDRSKMSVAEMLAAARAGGAAGAKAPAPAAAKPQAEEAPVQAKTPVPEPDPGEVAAATAKPAEKVDKSKMTIDDIVAWCRQHDAK